MRSIHFQQRPQFHNEGDGKASFSGSLIRYIRRRFFILPDQTGVRMVHFRSDTSDSNNTCIQNTLLSSYFTALFRMNQAGFMDIVMRGLPDE